MGWRGGESEVMVQDGKGQTLIACDAACVLEKLLPKLCLLRWAGNITKERKETETEPPSKVKMF